MPCEFHALITGNWGIYTTNGRHIFQQGFFFSFFPTVKMSALRQGKVSTHLENIQKWNMWITHIECWVDEVQVSRGSRGRKSEAAEDKTDFSRIRHLASQTFLVNCLCSFIDVSPSKSIQNLSHFRCSIDPDNHLDVWLT